MQLAPRHLARRSPPAGWEAYFLIGIFPRGSELAWCKVQVFSGGRHARRYCLSAVEAIDGAADEVVMLGRPGDVSVRRTLLGERELGRGGAAWDLATPRLRWKGAFPELALEVDLPSLRARTSSRDLVWWARFPRVLSYWGAFGPLVLDGQDGVHTGLGVVEHAWGAQLHVDPAALAPRRWHWDVLSLEGGGSFAGLAVGVLGRLRGLRTAGSASPDRRFAFGHALSVQVDEWREEHGRQVPARWSGCLRTSEGTLRYSAGASTPLAPVIPGGGFLGFGFEGEWAPGSGPARPVAGTGFTEYRSET